MIDHNEDSVLLVHHRDISSPVGTTVPHYLSNELSDSCTVHVVCRKQAKERGSEPGRDGDSERSGESERNDDSGRDAVFYAVNTGDVPILSTIVFQLLSVFLVALLGLRHRYTAVYAFQSSLIQGWVGSRFGGARFVVGLQSVPVRQSKDFLDSYDHGGGIRIRLLVPLLSLYSLVVGRLLERCSTVVCLTDGIADVTEEVYDVDLSDAHVLGMGVAVETFSDARKTARFDDRTDGWTLTYIGNVSETRGLERVLEALPEIDRDVTFRIAGQGPPAYVDSLQERAEELNVSEQVEWLGLLPHEEVPDLLSTSDVTISPLPDIESYRVSFPAKLLEYMAAGTLVVATDIPPHRRLIEDGANGYLYDGSREAFVETIEQAIETEDRSDLERRARQTAEAYDWEIVVERYEAVIFDTHAPESPPAPSRTQEAIVD